MSIRRAYLVPASFNDGCKTLLGDTHERVWVRSRAHRVDCDADRAIGTVLETDRERYTRHELTVKLRLGRACTDGTPGDQVGEVLRRDGIEELRADGNAQLCEAAQKLTGNAETLVDAEGAVDVGIVDEALPADSRARFLDETVSHVL